MKQCLHKLYMHDGFNAYDMGTPYNTCVFIEDANRKTMSNGKAADAILMTSGLLKRERQTHQWIAAMMDHAIKQGFPEY